MEKMIEEELREWDSGEWKEWDRRGTWEMGQWGMEGMG
jgi:hypothetical protein